MDFAHLRYIVAAAEHSSFRRAAVALNVTQPTLSKRIREVEDRLGVLLFERSTSGAVLTPIGQDFVVSARRALAELDAMITRAKAGKRGDVGRLEIGLYTSLSTGPLRDVILSFIAGHPDVEVNLNESSRTSLIADLDRGAVDVTVLLGEPNSADHAHTSLWSDRILVALPKDHPFAAREFVYWTDLKHERFLLSCRDSGPVLQDLLQTKLTSPGDRPHVKLMNASREIVISMVAGNAGVSLSCESATGNIGNEVAYREIRDGNGPARISYTAYWRRNNDNSALKQFLNLLQLHPAAPPTGRSQV